MWAVATVVLVTAVVVFAILAGSLLIRKKHSLAHEKLDSDYSYRKEPHTDQVTEFPNKLRDNPVTDVEDPK